MVGRADAKQPPVAAGHCRADAVGQLGRRRRCVIGQPRHRQQPVAQRHRPLRGQHRPQRPAQRGRGRPAGQLDEGLLVVPVAQALQQRLVQRLLRPLLAGEPPQRGGAAVKTLIPGPVQQPPGRGGAIGTGKAAAGQQRPEFGGGRAGAGGVGFAIAIIIGAVQQAGQGNHRRRRPALQHGFRGGCRRPGFQRGVQGHTVIVGVSAVAVGVPVAGPPVDFHIAADQPQPLDLQQRGAEIRAGGGGGAAGIQHPDAAACAGAKFRLPGGAALPQLPQQPLRQIAPPAGRRFANAADVRRCPAAVG